LKTVTGVKKFAKKFLANVKKTEIPGAIEQLQAIAKLITEDKEFRTFVISPIFNDKEINKALDFISKKTKATPKVAKYLQYLHNERALGSLPQIAEIINLLYLEMQKRSLAVITTAESVGKKDETDLKKILKKVTGREVDTKFVVDPALIGGMRIRIGSTMYDSSIKGQLGLLRDKFIEG
jgi:F-type H+-transporting ATPase subunit delta